MKTTYTILAILATVLFSHTTAAQLGAIRSTIQPESKIEINVEAEIINHINNMLSNLKKPSIKSDIAKQLDIGMVQLQTNEIVQRVTEKLPEFKFKVVIAD
jgi:hypothetical protein